MKISVPFVASIHVSGISDKPLLEGRRNALSLKLYERDIVYCYQINIPFPLLEIFQLAVCAGASSESTSQCISSNLT